MVMTTWSATITIIVGNNIIEKERIREVLGLSLNEPYNPVGLNDNLYLLENEYHEQGKLFFDVSIKAFHISLREKSAPSIPVILIILLKILKK